MAAPIFPNKEYEKWWNTPPPRPRNYDGEDGMKNDTASTSLLDGIIEVYVQKHSFEELIELVTQIVRNKDISEKERSEFLEKMWCGLSEKETA